MRSVLERFVRRSGYTVDSDRRIDLYHLSHPDYSSIKSITDTLDSFGIPNMAANISVKSIEMLPSRFLAFFVETEVHSYGLVERKGNSVVIGLENTSDKELSFKEFLSIWTGDLVAIEEVQKKAKMNLVPITVSLIGLGLATMFWLQASWSVLSTVVLSLLGLFFVTLTVTREMNIYTETADRFCSSDKSGVDRCTAIISSDVSKIFGTYSLSDLGFAFFLGNILSLALVQQSSSVLFQVGVVGVPIIVYSLYTQFFVLKKTCTICLLISSVYCAIILIWFRDVARQDFSFNLMALIKVLLVNGGILAVWVLVRDLLKDRQELFNTKKDFMKLRRNRRVLNTLLGDRVIESNCPASALSFGAPDASLEIIAITNPLCTYCTESINAYEAILRRHGDHVGLKIVFVVPMGNKEDLSLIISTRIISIYRSGDRSKSLEALISWYREKDFANWDKLYGEIGVDVAVEKDLLEQRNWCQSNRLAYTPITVVDRYVFPPELSVKDLPLLLDEWPLVEPVT